MDAPTSRTAAGEGCLHSAPTLAGIVARTALLATSNGGRMPSHCQLQTAPCSFAPLIIWTGHS